MNDRLLTIQEAAKLLKVSTKTLRRWEKQGKLIAQRTIGNQRRYTLTQVTAFKQKPFTPVAAISSARVGQLGSEFEKDHASFAEASKNTLVEELGEEHHLISVLRNINDHINAPQKYMVIGYLSVFVVLLSATVLVKTGTVKLPAAGKSALGTVTQKIASDFVNPSQAVLAAATSPLNDILKVNVKSQFAQDADFLSDVRIKGQLAVTNVASFSAQTFFGGDLTATDHNLDLGTGKITASNVVYGITAGTGISISGGQNPVITNTDPASGLKIFSKFIVAGTNMPATSNNDVITLTQGTGITLSAAPGAGTNQITIAATDLGPWTVNGSSVVLKTTSNNVGIGTTTAGQKLDVNGNINVSGNLIFSSSTPVIQSSSNITFTPQNGATGGAIVPLSADATDLGSPSLEFRNIYAQNFIPGSSGVSGFWQRPAGTGSIAPSNITDSINIGGIATSSALEHFAGTSGENSFFNTGNVGIGTTNPQALLHIRSSNDGSEKLMLVLDNSGDSVNTASGIGFNTNGSYTQTAKIVDLRTNESGQGDTALTFYVQDNAGGSPPGLTEKMRINARGNVGIGSTNPGSLLDVSGNVRATTFNGNTLTTGTGTLTLPAGKTVSFADAFQTSGAFSLVLTTTGATNVTLPTTGTLLTNTAAANQTITSTQQSGTVLGVSDTTNITGAIIGQSVTLSGTGAFDQTGLKFNLSGASGANLNDIVGTSSSWKIATTGDATFNSVSTNSFNSGSISSSGTILGPDGSAASPSFAFTNSTHTGLFRAGADILGVSTNSTERMRIDSNGNVGIGTTSPIGLVNIVGAPVGKALVNLNYTGTDQNIFVASKSGVTKFVIDNTGTITTGIWQGTPIATSSGGTGQVAYIGGDILYAAGPTTLSPLHIGSTNQVLAVSSSGLPVWATAGGGGGGLCSDCLINDPTVSSTNTVTPGASSVTALTLLGAVSDNANIFTVKNHSAGSTYFNINSSGVIDSGTWQGTAVGAQYGGTGQTLYGVGDLLYADTTTHLTRLPVGSQNQVLTISNSTNLPVWSTGSGGGGFCSDCLVSDPTTSLINTVAASASGVVAFTLRAPSDSTDIFNLTSRTAPFTTYAKITSAGNFFFNDTLTFANGINSNLYSIDTNGNSYFAIDKSNKVETGFVNGNVISTGSGTLTLGAGKTLTANSSLTLAGTDGKTLTVSGSTTLADNVITFGGGETLTLAAAKNVQFADAFQTSGAFSLVLTTTGATNVTLPTTGTLLTNTAAAGQTITSSQASGTIFGITDTTNITGAITGQAITMSGTGAFDQTGLKFNLSGASGSNVNDVLGTLNNWFVTATGSGYFKSLNVNGSNQGMADVMINQTNGSSDLFTASASGTNRFVITNVGNVGIGTSLPTAALAVGSSANFTVTSAGVMTTAGRVGLASATDGAYSAIVGDLGGSGALKIQLNSDAHFIALFANGQGNHFLDRSGQKMVLTSDGGTPYTLALDRSTGNIGIGTTTTTSFLLQAAGSVGPNTDASYDLGSTSLRWRNLFLSGNLGIGTTSTSVPLDVQGSGGVLGTNLKNIIRLVNTDTATANNTMNIEFDAKRTGTELTPAASISALLTNIGNTTYTGALAFSTAGTAAIPTERMRIDGTGNVGIGTTAPSDKLQIVGAQGFSIPLRVHEGTSGSGTEVAAVGFGVATSGEGSNIVKMGVGANRNQSNGRGYLQFYNNYTADTSNFAVGDEIMEVTNTGLHIGTNVAPNGGFRDLTVRTRSGSSPFLLINGGSSNGLLEIWKDESGAGSAPSKAVAFGMSDTGAITDNFYINTYNGTTWSPRMIILNASGNVGIGTTSPLATLHIKGTVNTQAGEIIDVTTSNDLFTASLSGATKFVITNAGNIGIGTTAPGSLLDLQGSGGKWDGTNGTLLTNLLRLENTDANAANNAAVEGYWAKRDGNILTPVASVSGIITNVGGTTYTGALAFSTAGTAAVPTERMRIDGTGNVGIGTTSPQDKLDVNGAIKVRGAAASNVASTGVFDFSAGNTRLISWGADASTNGGIQFISQRSDGSNSLTPLVINTSGNVGVGTTGPLAKLDIAGATLSGGDSTLRGDVIIRQQAAAAGSAGGLEFKADANSNGYGSRILNAINGGSTAYDLAFQMRAASATWTTQMTLQAGGNLGIGTTGPTDLFEVRKDTAGTATEARINNGDNTNTASNANLMLQVGGASGGNPFMKYLISSTTMWTAGVDNADSDKFKISGAANTNSAPGTNDRLVIDTSGNVGIGTTTLGNKFQVDMGGSATTSTAAIGVTGNFSDTTAGSQFGVFTIATQNANKTSGNLIGTYSRVDVAASTTLGNAYDLFLENPQKGASAVVTNAYGLWINAISAGGTTNEAIHTAGGKVSFACSANFTNAASVTSCSDYAEEYDSADATLAAGDVITIDTTENNKVAKSSGSYQPQIVGVYSTSPGVLIGPGGIISAAGEDVHLPAGKVPVALTGRVPVKVNLENGPIQKGDYLTSSSTPGYAMKATKAGRVIGMAMEDFDGTGNEKITAFVNPTFHDPDVYLADSGNLNIQTGAGTFSLVNGTTGEQVTRVGAFGDLAAAKAKFGQLDVTDLKIGGVNVRDYVNSLISDSLNGTLSPATPSAIAVTRDSSSFAVHSASDSASPKVATIDSYGNMTLSGTLHVGKLIADEVDTGSVQGLASGSATLATSSAVLADATNVDISSNAAVQSLNNRIGSLNDRISQLQTFIDNSASASALLASGSASTNFAQGSSLDINDATVSGTLNVLGRSVLSDVGVTGNISAGLLSIHGLEGEINTIGTPLKLQSEGLEGVDIANGKVTIDTSGNITTSAEITASKINVGNQASGASVVPSGQTSITISSPKVTANSLIFVTSTVKTDQPLSVTHKQEGTSFTVELDHADASDIRFNWIIVN